MVTRSMTVKKQNRRLFEHVVQMPKNGIMKHFLHSVSQVGKRTPGRLWKTMKGMMKKQLKENRLD